MNIWKICPACLGEGTRALNGLSLIQSEFHEDPEFAASYMSGVYDTRCEPCNGNGKVLDLEAMAEEQAGGDEEKEMAILFALEKEHRSQRTESYYDAVQLMEMRAGA